MKVHLSIIGGASTVPLAFELTHLLFPLRARWLRLIYLEHSFAGCLWSRGRSWLCGLGRWSGARAYASSIETFCLLESLWALRPRLSGLGWGVGSTGFSLDGGASSLGVCSRFLTLIKG